MNRYVIAITGASGSILSLRLLEFLSEQQLAVDIIATDNGQAVFEYETGIAFRDFILSISDKTAKITLHKNDYIFSPLASGSYPVAGMAIVPCSMATVGKIASVSGDSLLCRTADVCIKENRRLVIVARETPLSTLHLKNLLALSECGATILPPCPMFYHKNKGYNTMIDGIVGRVLNMLGIDNKLYEIWGDPNEN